MWAPVVDINGTSYLDGANFVAAVFVNGVQLGATAPFRTGAGAGYWNPGADSVRVVPGHFSGETVSGFTVQVWDSLSGATLLAARAAGGKYGESKAFSITLGGPRSDQNLPPDLPAVMVNFPSFSFAVVPEPAVPSLVVLGVLSLLISGRVKRVVASQSRENSKIPS